MWFLFVYLDSIIIAIKSKKYHLKSYNRLSYYFLIIVTFYIISLFYSPSDVLGIKTYKMSTTSGEPNLYVSDFLISNKREYCNKNPDYGDIVIFNNEKNEKHTYRVVGLPFDTVEVLGNILYLNGKSCLIEGALTDYRSGEILPNGHFYNVNHEYNKGLGKKYNDDKKIVPADSYYLLGDNRSNALDSRFIGTINKESIEGRILYSYLGESTDRIGIDFTDK
jgi:signal peptidase I